MNQAIGQIHVTRNAQRKQMVCPHCGSQARIRVSRRLSPLYIDGIVECQDLEECGWRGRFGIEVICTLTQSAKPSPNVTLPVSEYVLPSSPYALPAKLRVKTKNPFDPHHDQLPLDI